VNPGENIWVFSSEWGLAVPSIDHWIAPGLPLHGMTTRLPPAADATLPGSWFHAVIAAMAFSFRHRIELHEPQSLPVSECELVLADTGESRVVLVSRGRDTDIYQTQHLELLGSGYESEVEAHRAGEGWRSILQRVFAANRVGADVGDRAPEGGLIPAGREAIEEKGRDLGHEIQALTDKHGLIVFQSDPTPVFIGMTGTGYAPVSADRFTRALNAPASRTPTTSRERTAYDLFAASFRRSIGAEARLLLLMTAVEVLMDQRPEERRQSSTWTNWSGLPARPTCPRTTRSRLSDP